MVFDLADNQKLIDSFGAKPLSEVTDKPDFYTFTKGLIYSHRDFDRYYKALKAGKKCAIVSGVNASGKLHIGHKPVFDTVKYFQSEFDVDVYVPISDDESYVSKKVETQEEALENAYQLAREFIAYGFNPKKTFFIIDQIYTNIYNLAIKLSRKVTMNEIKAVYGYTMSDNPGLFFYPTIQSAHVLFPLTKGYDDVLVPIGPDEDAHLRIGRDLAGRFNFKKPSVIHLSFMAGIDGEKMSKSKGNTIDLKEPSKALKKKVNKCVSGGQETVEEHRKLGGNPDIDIAYQYLKNYYLTTQEAEELATQYKAGELLSGEMKLKLFEKLDAELTVFQSNLEKTQLADIDECILRNE